MDRYNICHFPQRRLDLFTEAREKRRDSGCDRDLAQALRTRAGIASGPVAFEQSSCCKWRSTVSGRKCTADKGARHLGSRAGSSSKARSYGLQGCILMQKTSQNTLLFHCW